MKGRAAETHLSNKMTPLIPQRLYKNEETDRRTSVKREREHRLWALERQQETWRTRA